MAKEKSPTSLPTCASCKREVGKEAGRVPFFVDDCARESGETAKHEAFCPQCFVYVRSPREPERFRPGNYVPLKCGAQKCGLESVSIGSDHCMQCNSRIVIVLPPHPGAM